MTKQVTLAKVEARIGSTNLKVESDAYADFKALVKSLTKAGFSVGDRTDDNTIGVTSKTKPMTYNELLKAFSKVPGVTNTGKVVFYPLFQFKTMYLSVGKGEFRVPGSSSRTTQPALLIRIDDPAVLKRMKADQKAGVAEIYGDITIGNKEFSWDGDDVETVQKQMKPYVNKPLVIGLDNGKYGWEYSDAEEDGNIQVNFKGGRTAAAEKGKNFSGKLGLPMFLNWLMAQK